eukprot:2969075-Rhodomonas_salina.2
MSRTQPQSWPSPWPMSALGTQTSRLRSCFPIATILAEPHAMSGPDIASRRAHERGGYSGADLGFDSINARLPAAAACASHLSEPDMPDPTRGKTAETIPADPRPPLRRALRRRCLRTPARPPTPLLAAPPFALLPPSLPSLPALSLLLLLSRSHPHPLPLPSLPLRP